MSLLCPCHFSQMDLFACFSNIEESFNNYMHFPFKFCSLAFMIIKTQEWNPWNTSIRLISRVHTSELRYIMAYYILCCKLEKHSIPSQQLCSGNVYLLHSFYPIFYITDVCISIVTLFIFLLQVIQFSVLFNWDMRNVLNITI